MSRAGEQSAWWGESDDDLRYEPPPGATQQVSDRSAWVRQSSAVVQATTAAIHSTAQPAGTPADDLALAEAEDEWDDAEEWMDVAAARSKLPPRTFYRALRVSRAALGVPSGRVLRYTPDALANALLQALARESTCQQECAGGGDVEG